MKFISSSVLLCLSQLASAAILDGHQNGPKVPGGEALNKGAQKVAKLTPNHLWWAQDQAEASPEMQKVFDILDEGRLCTPQMNLTLEAHGIGSVVFHEGYLYALETASAPVVWQFWPKGENKFTVFHVDQFGTTHYLREDDAHMRTSTSSGDAGSFKVRYAVDTDGSTLVLGQNSRCLYVDAVNGKVNMAENSACTPLTFVKHGTHTQSRWIDPSLKNSDVGCSGTLRKYLDKLAKGELTPEAFLYDGDLAHTEGFKEFVQGLPVSLIAAPIVAVGCAVGSKRVCHAFPGLLN